MHINTHTYTHKDQVLGSRLSRNSQEGWLWAPCKGMLQHRSLSSPANPSQRRDRPKDEFRQTEITTQVSQHDGTDCCISGSKSHRPRWWRSQKLCHWDSAPRTQAIPWGVEEPRVSGTQAHCSRLWQQLPELVHALCETSKSQWPHSGGALHTAATDITPIPAPTQEWAPLPLSERWPRPGGSPMPISWTNRTMHVTIAPRQNSGPANASPG